MTTVIIPKELNKNQEFIAIPRGVYEEFLAWQGHIKSIKITEKNKKSKRPRTN